MTIKHNIRCISCLALLAALCDTKEGKELRDFVLLLQLGVHAEARLVEVDSDIILHGIVE